MPRPVLSRRILILGIAGITAGLFGLTACGMDWNNIFGSDEGEPAPAEPSSVLFIGNSLTFWHEVPTLFWELSRASGREMEVHQITRGGASIQDHLEDEVTRDMVHSQVWDWVVLQGSSYAIAFPGYEDDFTALYQAFRDTIHASSPQARVIIYLDYALPTISAGDVTYTYTEFQQMIHDGTMAVADALDLIVAPVGSAWDRVLAERPGIELYDTDGLHPSVEASYLMASVYYAVIHRRRLTDIEYYGEISNTLAIYLRGVAAEIVLENASHWHLP